MKRRRERLERLLEDVRKETARQDDLYPWPRSFEAGADDFDLVRIVSALEPYARRSIADHPNWLAILLEEVCEAGRQRDKAALIADLVQAAAVALSWAQAVMEAEP